MKRNFGAKSLLYPMPALIIGSYDENNIPNAMVAAWGCVSDFDQVTVIVDAAHKTLKNILARKAFTVSIADATHVLEVDYLGNVSGNDEPDKVAKLNLHTEKSEFVDAPVFSEFPLVLECEFVSFDEEPERLIGKVLNLGIDEAILGENGKIDLTKFHPIVYDSHGHTYTTLGEQIGLAYEDYRKLQ